MNEISDDRLEEFFSENTLFHESIRQAFQYGLGIDILDAKSIQNFHERQIEMIKHTEKAVRVQTHINHAVIWLIATTITAIGSHLLWWMHK